MDDLKKVVMLPKDLKVELGRNVPFSKNYILLKITTPNRKGDKNPRRKKIKTTNVSRQKQILLYLVHSNIPVRIVGSIAISIIKVQIFIIPDINRRQYVFTSEVFQYLRIDF